MIGIRNQDGLFDQIERELLHESYPASCNLVVPPGFGEHSLVKAIGKRLCDREPTSGALVAVIEPDSLKGHCTRLCSHAPCPMEQTLSTSEFTAGTFGSLGTGRAYQFGFRATGR